MRTVNVSAEDFIAGRAREVLVTGSHRTSLRQIRKACAAEGHHWQSWDRWINYCTHCGLRRPA